MIKAPFNFVPLSDRVFFPDWAEEISHDIPFEDAQSGVIDITIKAKSPIFIRNHSTDKNNQSSEFCQHNGIYYIPGSSIKGVIRNVMEIMSFSKIGIFDDNTYAFRDLNNKNHYMSKMKPDKTYCGWLKKIDGKYYIEDCGFPGRIRLDKIDSKCSSRFNRNYNEKDDDNKTAKFKYELFEDIEMPTKFTHKKNDNSRDIYEVGDEKDGIIVFTGQPSKRIEGKDPSGKIYEFIFFRPGENIEVEESIFNNFKFAYLDGRKTQPKESPDWTYWKEKLQRNEKVPVFFHKNDSGDLVHFGLSYLYKLPYKYSIKHAIEAISKDHTSRNIDLTQAIFGYIDKEDNKGLKGRVQFSHFKVDSQPEKFRTVTTVLGSPRASYYPIYIKQSYEAGSKMIKDGKYYTLMDKGSQIAGRKRYPLHQYPPNPKKYDKSVDSATTFTPLGRYSDKTQEFNEFTFSGKMRYHNLKKVELGALLSALTFHGNSDNFYHSIGMAKPLGFGKIEIEVSMRASEQIVFLREYEELMRDALGCDWLDSRQLKELFAMASKDLSIDKYLKYLTLDPTQKIDEFREKKSAKEYLPSITDISKKDIKIGSFLDSDTVNNFTLKEEAKQTAIKKEKERIARKNELLNSTPSGNSNEFKDAIKNYVLKNIELPYYDYSDLKKLFEYKDDEIIADDIYNAYIELAEKETYKTIEPLLQKREKNKISEIELAELYSLLCR